MQLGKEWRSLVQLRFAFDLLNVLDDVLEGGPPLRLIEEAVVHDLSEVSVAALGHLQPLTVVTHNACDLGNGPPHVGDVSSQHLPQNHSEGVNVGSLLISLSPQDLGSHPVRSAYFTLVIHLEFFFIPCKAEVTNFHTPILIKKNVLGLEIAMENFFLVEIHRCHCNLLGHFVDLLVI